MVEAVASAISCMKLVKLVNEVIAALDHFGDTALQAHAKASLLANDLQCLTRSLSSINEALVRCLNTPPAVAPELQHVADLVSLVTREVEETSERLNRLTTREDKPHRLSHFLVRMMIERVVKKHREDIVSFGLASGLVDLKELHPGSHDTNRPYRAGQSSARELHVDFEYAKPLGTGDRRIICGPNEVVAGSIENWSECGTLTSDDGTDDTSMGTSSDTTSPQHDDRFMRNVLLNLITNTIVARIGIPAAAFGSSTSSNIDNHLVRGEVRQDSHSTTCVRKSSMTLLYPYAIHDECQSGGDADPIMERLAACYAQLGFGGRLQCCISSF